MPVGKRLCAICFKYISRKHYSSHISRHDSSKRLSCPFIKAKSKCCSLSEKRFTESAFVQETQKWCDLKRRDLEKSSLVIPPLIPQVQNSRCWTMKSCCNHCYRSPCKLDNCWVTVQPNPPVTKNPTSSKSTSQIPSGNVTPPLNANNRKKIACALCVEYFETKLELLMHYFSAHPSSDQAMTFTCTKCFKIFRSRQQKVEHELVCNMRYKICRLCDPPQKFATKQLMEEHFLTEHTIEERVSN